MATVKIYRDEAEGNLLPSVCIKCGEPATHYTSKTFCCAPSGLQLPIFELIVGRRMTAQLPLCDAHRLHWFAFPVIGVGGGAMYLTSFACFFLASPNPPASSSAPAPLSVLAGIGLCLGPFWLVAMGYLFKTRISAGRITRDWMLLMEVSEEFCNALDRQREEEDDPDGDLDREDDSERERRSHIISGQSDGRM